MGVVQRPLVEEPWFDALVRVSRRLHIQNGETLRHALDRSETLDVVLSGEVEFWQTDVDGRETWLGVCGRGSVVGTSLTLCGVPDAFDSVAIGNLAVLRISRSALSRLAEAQPEFLHSLSARLSELLRDSRRLITEAQTLSARERIESELMRLSGSDGALAGRRIIRPSPVFADMARRANTTRETVSRTVAALCKSGVLERQPGALLILKPGGLGRAQAPDSV